MESIPLRVLLGIALALAATSCTEQRGAASRPAQAAPATPTGGYQPTGGFAPSKPAGPGYCESVRQRSMTCPVEGLRVDAACASAEARCLQGVLRTDFHAAYLDCIRNQPCGAANIDDLCMGLTLRRMPLATPTQQHVQQACLARGPACPNKLAHTCRVLPRANEQVLHAVNECFAYRDCGSVEQCVDHTLDRFGCP